MNKKDYKELEARIGEERVEALSYYWNNETNDEETQEWRDELTDDEQLLVDRWDGNYDSGIKKLYIELLEAEREYNEARKRGKVTK